MRWPSLLGALAAAAFGAATLLVIGGSPPADATPTAIVVDVSLPAIELDLFPDLQREDVILETGRTKEERATAVATLRCCVEGFCFFCPESTWPARIRIPAGTTFAACTTAEDGCAGGRFRTLEDAVIRTGRRVSEFFSTAARTRVPIEAVTAGALGNGTIDARLPGAFGGEPVWVLGVATGGTDPGRRYLAAGDVARTRRAIETELKEQARGRLSAMLPAGARVADWRFSVRTERNPLLSRFRQPFREGPETLLVSLDATAIAYDPRETAFLGEALGAAASTLEPVEIKPIGDGSVLLLRCRGTIDGNPRELRRRFAEVASNHAVDGFVPRLWIG